LTQVFFSGNRWKSDSANQNCMVDVEEISATEFQESEGLDTTVRSSIVKNIFLSSIFLIFLPNSLIEAIYDSS